MKIKTHSIPSAAWRVFKWYPSHALFKCSMICGSFLPVVEMSDFLCHNNTVECTVAADGSPEVH